MPTTLRRSGVSEASYNPEDASSSSLLSASSPSSSSSHTTPPPSTSSLTTRSSVANVTSSDPRHMTTSAISTGQESNTAASVRARKGNHLYSTTSSVSETTSTAGSQAQDKNRRKAASGSAEAAPESHEDSETTPGKKKTGNTMPTLPPAPAPHPKWVPLALLSGAFAAMNGVFAKLTTSSDTPPMADFFTHLLPFLTPTVIQVVLRSIFFGLNLASNAVMWALFTRALTSHPSTTKVSVVNTSANFALTAVMGALVFRESLGGIGGLFGMALLVGGCVVLGAKKEGGSEGGEAADPLDTEVGRSLRPRLGEDDETLVRYSDDPADQVVTPKLYQSDDEQEPDLISLETQVEESADRGAILDGTESDNEDER